MSNVDLCGEGLIAFRSRLVLLRCQRRICRTRAFLPLGLFDTRGFYAEGLLKFSFVVPVAPSLTTAQVIAVVIFKTVSPFGMASIALSAV